MVDARSIGAKPAMIPLILDEKGEEVYGPAFVSREFAVQEGMSGYEGRLKIAQDSARVAPNPLTVKGLRTQTQAPTAIVISHADAAKIRSTSENLSFLKECRVIIVVD